MALAFMPTAWQATFEVPAQQAKWAEYLCERIGLAVVRGSVDRTARRNADKYNFKPPPRWDGRDVQIETTCSDGMALWKALQRGERPQNISDELMQTLTQEPRHHRRGSSLHVVGYASTTGPGCAFSSGTHAPVPRSSCHS